MPINRKFEYTWHVGETATPFAVTLEDENEVERTDIVSATFTMRDREDDSVAIATTPCVVSGARLSYRPTALQMATPRKFLCQFVATTSAGYVLPTVHIEGEIERNL